MFLRWNYPIDSYLDALFINTIFLKFEFPDLEQSLLSMEKLDRASPDIWPERICKFDCNLSNICFQDI